MKKKVYCNECEYYKYQSIYGHGGMDCDYPINIVFSSPERNDLKKLDREPEEINEKNDCEWWKKKRTLWEKIRGRK